MFTESSKRFIELPLSAVGSSSDCMCMVEDVAGTSDLKFASASPSTESVNTLAIKVHRRVTFAKGDDYICDMHPTWEYDRSYGTRIVAASDCPGLC